MNIFVEAEGDNPYSRYPIVLVDIGARGGLQPNWRSAQKHLKVIGFEPDPEEFASLEKSADANIRYFNTALHNQPGTIKINLTKSGGVSSTFDPNRKFLDQFPESGRFDVIRQIEAPADSLDNVLRSNGVDDVDFLKIDTQGSELQILEGAATTLEKTVLGLEVEVEFAHMYQGQPLFSDVDQLVRKYGFELFDLRPCYWKRESGRKYGKLKGQLIFGDVLYLRGLDSLHKLLAQIHDPIEKKAKAMHMLSICFLYGYLDYGLEVFESMEGLFSAEERRSFMKKLEAGVSVSTRMPAFKGRGRIANVFNGIYRAIDSGYNGWCTGGRRLGNLE